MRPIHAAADANAYSPESLYCEFRTAARSAQDGVRRFRTILKDPDTKAALGRAREAQRPEGNVESWLVEQHAQWLDEPAVRIARDFEVEEDIQEGLEPVKEEVKSRGEDVPGIVKGFKVGFLDTDSVKVTLTGDEGAAPRCRCQAARLNQQHPGPAAPCQTQLHHLVESEYARVAV